MACEVMQTALGPTFICGTITPAVKCHFCGELAAYLCDFKVDKWVPVQAANVQIGDTLKTSGGARWKVVYKAIEGDFVLLAADNGRSIEQGKCAKTQTFSSLSSGTCDEACCYNCAREVDDDVHYCRASHWSLPS